MWQGVSSRLRAARISGVGLYDFLAQQVLDQQPPPVRDFLLQTSFLEEFDATLCEAVWGKNNWPSLIDTILQHNLFILPVGDDGKYIRYHHLFRDFLQARFKQERSQEVDGLLHLIASAYTRQGEWEKAYAVYQRLGAITATADLVEKAGPSLVENSRLATLANWIDALPGEIVALRPRLLSHKGAVLLTQGQVENGLRYLDQAETAQRTSVDLTGLAYTLARRATAYRYLGKYQVSIDDGYEALRLAEQDGNLRPVRAESLRAIGVSLYYLGRLSEAIDKFHHSLAEYEALGEKSNVALVHMELGMSYRKAGSLRQTLEHYERALAYWREVNNTTRLSFILNNLGVLYHLTGDYIQAMGLFEEALTYARQNRVYRTEAYLLCSIGDLYMELEADASAKDAYHHTREIAEQIDDRFLLLYVAIADATQARRRGETIQARALLQAARELALNSQSSYETALWRLEAGQIDLVSGNTQEAADHLTEAVRLFSEGGQKVESARANIHLARACYAMKNISAALSAMNQAFILASDIESRHILVVAGRESRNLLIEACHDATIGAKAAVLINQIDQFESQIPVLHRRLRSHARAVLLVPPKLTIHAMGRVQVELNGRPVAAVEWLNQKRVRELFFYLLTHPEGLTREEVGAVLWPESSPAQLKLQFKNAVYRLRFALGQNVVLFDENRYRFNNDLDYEYDAQTYEEKINRAKAADSSTEKITCYLAAVDVYRGTFLPEVGGTWVLVDRQRLWQMYVEAILTLARLYLESTSYTTALEFCRRALEEDRCLEEAHRLAMRAYSALGDRAEVARQFEDCCLALQEEVASEPSPQTVSLYQTLRH
jgi:DNA-binding SARP family transcriptional activator